MNQGNQMYLFSHLVKTDIKKRYQGSVLGGLWSILIPLIMLSIYTFIFSEIFSTKWSVDTGNKFEFAMMLFCGLSLYNMFSNVLGRAVGLIAENQNYVKKVVFPIHILPVVITASALFDCLISYGVLIVANCVLGGGLYWTVLEAPLVLIPHVFFCVGVTYLVSSIAVYLKDIANVISVIITVFMYMSPVFFPLTAVPESFRWVIMLNPMTYAIENMRRVLIYGSSLRLDYWLISVVSAVVVFFAGKWIFMKAKVGFAQLL